MIGFLNIYKPSGITSNAVVQRIKKKFHCKKIGHMGTLDPMACGILPIAIGKATRLFDYALNKTKTYIAIFDFGYTTDTLDITGQITDRSDCIIETTDIESVLPQFIGKISQLPPKYSAKNINGTRAYNLARLGVDFELKPKDIEIFDIRLLEKIDTNRFKFMIKCSSGTYIRSIARDIGIKLNTYGCMSFLERIETGNFNVSTAIKLDDIENFDDISEILLSPLDVFANFDIINISKDNCVDLKNGKSLPYKKVDKNSFVVCENHIIGVVKPRDSYIKLDTYLDEDIYD